MSAALSVRVLASVLISSSPSETVCVRAVDEPSHQVLSQARVLGPVGLDQAPVNAPAGMDRSVALVGEQGLKVPGLGIGEQVGAGVQRVPDPVEPVSCPAPAPCVSLLDAAALVELAGKPGRRRGMGSMTARALGSSSPAALLNPGRSVSRARPGR